MTKYTRLVLVSSRSISKSLPFHVANYVIDNSLLPESGNDNVDPSLGQSVSAGEADAARGTRDKGRFVINCTKIRDCKTTTERILRSLSSSNALNLATQCTCHSTTAFFESPVAVSSGLTHFNVSIRYYLYLSYCDIHCKGQQTTERGRALNDIQRLLDI